MTFKSWLLTRKMSSLGVFQALLWANFWCSVEYPDTPYSSNMYGKGGWTTRQIPVPILLLIAQACSSHTMTNGIIKRLLDGNNCEIKAKNNTRWWKYDPNSGVESWWQWQKYPNITIWPLPRSGSSDTNVVTGHPRHGCFAMTSSLSSLSPPQKRVTLREPLVTNSPQLGNRSTPNIPSIPRATQAVGKCGEATKVVNQVFFIPFSQTCCRFCSGRPWLNTSVLVGFYSLLKVWWSRFHISFCRG